MTKLFGTSKYVVTNINNIISLQLYRPENKPSIHFQLKENRETVWTYDSEEDLDKDLQRILDIDK